MTRRPGLTLTEVLVTLGILAFGVLAILTLFPLAASQMAIAVREDRSAQAAAAADGYMRAYWKTEVVERANPTEQFYNALTDPNFGVTPHTGLVAANADEPSYPVVIDPMGVVARPGINWMGDTGGTNVTRRGLNLVSGAAYAQRVCSQMDGLGYDDQGHPLTVGGSSDREIRYNWLWVLQRPQNSNRHSATMTVVVFDNRPHLFAPNGSEWMSGSVTWTPGTTSVTVPGTPGIKAGGWVMDATVNTSTAGNKIRHANFYQVVSATVVGANTQLELQSPIKKANDPTVTGAYTGTIVILRGVSGVYVRPPLTAE